VSRGWARLCVPLQGQDAAFGLGASFFVRLERPAYGLGWLCDHKCLRLLDGVVYPAGAAGIKHGLRMS